ncbi:sulfite exporter TauE/SafE family protein [uncultured Friedmanniella sp.]|uniref:sulfite exporter TauE/SafE family protein n=1 Tax=uncultured Friedmanniella sp. TaxID=335381 RepID=UPI0035CC70C2
MPWDQLLLVGLAGGAAGLINTVVGSGTLITFPTLVALGVPPVLANVSNTVGLAPGSLSGALSMRPELAGQAPRLRRLGLASLPGGIVGALLLLRLPSAAFDAIVPVLIGLGCVLVLAQPTLSRRVATRRQRLGITNTAGSARGGPALWVGVLLTGVYGGYFGAAQGVLLIGLLGIALGETLTRVNAAKNVLAMIVNGVAGVVFIVVSDVDWPVAVTIAVGSVLGAQVGGRAGRRLPAVAYRVLIIAVGVVAIVALLG